MTSCVVDGDMQHMALPAFLSEVATDLLPSAEAVVLPATTMALQNTDVLSLQCGKLVRNDMVKTTAVIIIKYLLSYCDDVHLGRCTPVNQS